MAKNRKPRRVGRSMQPMGASDSSSAFHCGHLQLVTLGGAFVMACFVVHWYLDHTQLFNAESRHVSRHLLAWNYTSGTWATETPSASSGSSSSSSSSTSAKTLSPSQSSTASSGHTFLGLFPTDRLTALFCIGVPAGFMMFKLGLFCYFWWTYASYSAEHDGDPSTTPSAGSSTGTSAVKTSTGGTFNDGTAFEAVPDSTRHQNIKPRFSSTQVHTKAQAKPDPRGFGNTQPNATAQHDFWVDAELQPWRLNFHRIELLQCVTPMPRASTERTRTTASTSSASMVQIPITSEVWMGTYHYNNADEQSIALKWIASSAMQCEAQREKLKKELRRFARFQHRNVVAFVGLAWSPQTALIAATEFMSRGDLKMWLYRSKTQLAGHWTRNKLQMLVDIVDVLLYLHSFAQPVIHGNCNSRNVLLNEHLNAKLADFGADMAFVSMQELDRYQAEVGSGRWMPPEALMGQDGAEYMSPAMDVYSIGILIAEMDTHELPFADLTQNDHSELPEHDILELLANGALTPTLSRSCPRSIADLVAACTAFNPAKRPSIVEVAACLRDQLDAMTASIETATTTTTQMKPRRSSRRR